MDRRRDSASVLPRSRCQRDLQVPVMKRSLVTIQTSVTRAEWRQLRDIARERGVPMARLIRAKLRTASDLRGLSEEMAHALAFVLKPEEPS